MDDAAEKAQVCGRSGSGRGLTTTQAGLTGFIENAGQLFCLAVLNRG